MPSPTPQEPKSAIERLEALAASFYKGASDLKPIIQERRYEETLEWIASDIIANVQDGADVPRRLAWAASLRALAARMVKAPRFSPEEREALDAALDAIVCSAPPGLRYDEAAATIRKMLEESTPQP